MPIRIMKPDDLPQVLDIQRALAFQDWNEKQFTSEINASYALCVVYEDPGTLNGASKGTPAILGYAVFHLMGPDSELLSIATVAASQRKGISTELLQAGLTRLDFSAGDKMFLEVREGNENARAFYERHGFNAYAKRDGYYSDGETAILYRKDQ